MGDSPELREFDNLTESFKELGGRLFDGKDNLTKMLFVKFWGERYGKIGCYFDWSLVGGYRLVNLNIHISAEVGGPDDLKTYTPEKHYNCFRKTKKVFFGILHEAGINYMEQESIHSKVRLFSLNNYYIIQLLIYIR
jgi:hypothetical protein